MSERTHERPELYRRWAIGRTQSRGWEPKDATISARYAEGAEPTEQRMVDEAAKAIREAQAACDELNAQERQVARLKGSQAA